MRDRRAIGRKTNRRRKPSAGTIERSGKALVRTGGAQVGANREPVAFAASAGTGPVLLNWETIVPSCGIDAPLSRIAWLVDAIGPLELSVDRVVGAGCIARSTFYRRFGDMTGVLRAILETFAREFSLHLMRLAERSEDPGVGQACADVGAGGGQRRASAHP
jgi:hypothetical protein